MHATDSVYRTIVRLPALLFWAAGITANYSPPRTGKFNPYFGFHPRLAFLCGCSPVSLAGELGMFATRSSTSA